MKSPTIKSITVPLLRIALIAGSCLAISSKAEVPQSDLPNFDGLGNFAQLGNSITVHNATVNGNEGISSGGAFDLDTPGTVNGNLYQATGATATLAGTLNGSLFPNQNLSTDQSTVFSASVNLATLIPDETITGDQTSPLSFDVPAGEVEVIDLNGGLNLKHSDDITLTGGGDLVLNIMGSFTLQDAASIVGSPSDIFVNYEGTSAVTTDENDLVDGQLFFPDAEADLKSTFFGGIYSGDPNVELLANATLNAVPLPEPGSVVLVSAALASLLFWRAIRFCCTCES